MNGFMQRGSFVIAAALLVLGCSDDNDTGLTVARTATNSGNGQTGPAGEALTQPLRVIVTDEGGAPVNGITVSWSTPDGGSFDPAPSTTDIDGIAATNWTLGTAGGEQDAQASVNGASGSPVAFTATATGGITVITVSNNQFSPSDVTIDAGEQVRFVWGAGAAGHNVTPDAGNPAALPMSAGAPASTHNSPFEFASTFTAPGTYDFFCSVHSATGMSGTVTVN